RPPQQSLRAYLRVPNGKRRYLQGVKSALAAGQLTSFTEGKWFFQTWYPADKQVLTSIVFMAQVHLDGPDS
ncbi:hypothetical protein ACQP3L_34165, partial [Escherichia coli]